jgi:hypothetical protein
MITFHDSWQKNAMAAYTIT